MSEESKQSESPIAKSVASKPAKATKSKKAKPAKKEKQAKPAKARAPKGHGDLPRGYDSEDNLKALEKATLVLRKRFPTMKPAQWARYFEQVGAGRFLALAKYNG